MERAGEAGDREQARAVLGRGSGLGQRLDCGRRDEAAAQRHERPRERRRDRRHGRAVGQPQAGPAGLGEQPRREQGVVAAVPRPQPTPEQDGLGERARELERLQRVDTGERATGRGEPARKLDGGGARRDEQDERAEGHGRERWDSSR